MRLGQRARLSLKQNTKLHKTAISRACNHISEHSPLTGQSKLRASLIGFKIHANFGAFNGSVSRRPHSLVESYSTLWFVLKAADERRRAPISTNLYRTSQPCLRFPRSYQKYQIEYIFNFSSILSMTVLFGGRARLTRFGFSSSE